jgi:hypothetical protein
MADINTQQLREIYADNMLKASARARDLHKMTGLTRWHSISESLSGLRMRGLEIANQKSLSKSETEAGLDLYKKSFEGIS